MAHSASQTSGEPVSLLALDGGGIRGVSELLILDEIMRRVKYDLNLAEMPRPCDYFDLIGGTSTGGLIALMLGRLQMTTDEALRTYNTLSQAIFSKNNKKRFGQDGAFRATTLQEKVQEIVLQKGLGETMLDPLNHSTKGRAFVCAKPANNMAHVRLFRTYHVRDNASANCRIWEAARATTAAPTFFKRIVIEGEEFIDGALGCNNPAAHVLNEAMDVFGIDRPVRCLVSIGTGHRGAVGLAKPDAFQKIMPMNLVHVLKKITTDCEDVSHGLSVRFNALEKFYFRFNVVHGAEGISLEEWNKIGELKEHTKAYMTEVSVSKAINDVVDIICNRREVRLTLGACNIPQITNVSKTCWNVPFARNPLFVYRRSQLDQLESDLFATDQPPKKVITGLGGMGKTQIALELAYRTKKRHPDCSIIWVPAINTEAIQRAFTEAGQQLGLLRSEKEQIKAKKLIQHYLSQDGAGRWLLIIDNVDDIEIWEKELKDHLPRHERGAVVCTSRSRHVAVAIAASNVIIVPKMDDKMAILLLSHSLIDKKLLLHHQDAQKLLEQLTFLPLAIVQAAAYINTNGITISDYLSLLDAQEQDVLDLLSENFEDDGRYQGVKNPIATTWLISFEHVRRLNPLAAEYLSLMSCVVSKDIPLSLLPPGSSQVEKSKAIGVLDGYSFVSRRPGNYAVDIHRLVQLATRNWLRTKKQCHIWADKALVRLVEIIPLGGHEKREVWTAYLPHALHVVRLTELDDTEGRMSLLDRLGRCEWALGHYEAAKWAYQQLLAQRVKVSGEEDPLTLTDMNKVALALSGQGEYEDAEQMHKETLELREKVLGKKSAETLASMSNLGLALSGQGKYAEAEKTHKETLPLRKEVLGKEDPLTLASMNNLALALNNQRKHLRAEKMHQETLTLREKVLGKEHPSTLASMNNLAQALNGCKKYLKAEEMHRKTLILREKVLGKKHPSTLASMNNLALALSYQEKYAEAEKMHQETLTLREKVLGKEHPSTLASMNNLAQTLSYQGKETDAILLMQKCVQLRIEILGPQHPSTKASLRTLSKWQEAT